MPPSMVIRGRAGIRKSFHPPPSAPFLYFFSFFLSLSSSLDLHRVRVKLQITNLDIIHVILRQRNIPST